MAAQLWSGRTCYVKYQDANGRDVFAPQGYPLTVADDSAGATSRPGNVVPSPYAWRVKQDASSGKFFFVSLSTLPKRWRLPDLDDETFQQELIQWAQKQKSAAMAMSGGGDHVTALATTPNRLSSANTSGKATPSGRHGSTAANGADYGEDVAAHTTAPSNVQSSPALFVASPSPYFPKPSGGGPPPPPGQAGKDRKQLQAFDYDDAEWKATDAKHRRALQLQEEDFQMRLQQSIEVDEMRRGVGPGGRSLHSASDAGHVASPVHVMREGARGTPYDEFAVYGSDSHANAVAYELNRRRFDREGRQRAIHDELAALEAEERLLELQTKREEDQIKKLEMQQLDAVRQSDPAAAERYRHQQPLPSTHVALPPPSSVSIAPAPHLPQHQQHPQPVLDPYHNNYLAPQGVQQQQHHQPSGGSDVQHLTSVIQTLQKMLDHEREINAKLQKQLEEKEQLALEQLAADAEREQRDIAMRIRMLEAIAAHRREVELLAEEKRLEAEGGDLGGSETLRAQLVRQAQRYIPDHPLGLHGDE